MATTGTLNGTLILVAVEGENISCLTSATFNGTNETIDSTCKDNNGAKQYLLGSQDWNISASGNSAYDSAYGLRELEAAWKNKTIVTVTWGTGVSGDPYKTGEALISSFTEDAPLNAVATWSVTFQGTGVISLGNFT